jgi:hypothetical protein
MDNQNVFSFLKLKASFGVTGEQGVQMVMVTWCITLV